MTDGASDIVIPGAPSFICEIKRKDHTKSKWEKGQIEYLEAAYRCGAFVCVALGADGATEAFNQYLKETHHATQNRNNPTRDPAPSA